MRDTRGRVAATAAVVLFSTCSLHALTIPDVQQSSASLSWQSAYAGATVNVTGGVVTYAATPPGKMTGRMVIQDPNFSDWAGIAVKVFGGTLVADVQIGDRVDLTNVFVDESSKTYGNTYLLFDPTAYGSSFSIGAGGVAVPPTVVSPAVLGAGDSSADPAAAEKYEGMLVQVNAVTVGSLDLGSHADNYELANAGATCWASDYLNLDRVGPKYHDLTVTGASRAAVVGVLEQYAKPSDSYDYYQILTRSSADIVPEPSAAALTSAAAWLLIRRKRK